MSTIRYILRKNVINKVPVIDITEEEFEHFKQSRGVLTNAFEIEETYEVMLTNYVSFEKQLLNTAATYMVRSVQEYSDFFLERVALNASFINLLTTTKMFVDQIPRYARDCINGGKDELDEFKSMFSKQYDSVKEYRFIEALRNHVQHYGLPVHSMMFDSSWTSLSDNGLMEHATRLYCEKRYLEENKKFKKEVLQNCEDKIDLIYFVRRYIESLSEIHDNVRKRIQSTVDLARKCIQEGNDRYRKVHDDSLIGLYAMQLDNDRKADEVLLTLEWDDIRQKLTKRNPKIVNLKKRFVSSSATRESDRNKNSDKNN